MVIRLSIAIELSNNRLVDEKATVGLHVYTFYNFYDLCYYAPKEILQWRLQSANYAIGRGAIASNYFIYFD